MNTNNLGGKEVERKVIEILRNFPIWPSGWNNNNIFDYLCKIYHFNQSLAVDKKVKIYFSDVPWQWEGKTKENYDLFWRTEIPNRDKIMAHQIISKFHEILKSDSKRKRALVIMNTRHAYKVGDRNTGAFLFKEFPGKVANVTLNKAATDFSSGPKRDYDSRHSQFPTQDGKWDAAFWLLGNSSLGFNFKGSPFAKDPFDLHSRYAKFKYEDVFTGMIFYQPLGKHMIANNIPGYYDDEFKQTVLKRAKLKGDENLYNQLTKIFEILEQNPDEWSQRKQYWRDKTGKNWCRLKFKIASDPFKPSIPPDYEPMQ